MAQSESDAVTVSARCARLLGRLLKERSLILAERLIIEFKLLTVTMSCHGQRSC